MMLMCSTCISRFSVAYLHMGGVFLQIPAADRHLVLQEKGAERLQFVPPDLQELGRVSGLCQAHCQRVWWFANHRNWLGRQLLNWVNDFPVLCFGRWLEMFIWIIRLVLEWCSFACWPFPSCTRPIRPLCPPWSPSRSAFTLKLSWKCPATSRKPCWTTRFQMTVGNPVAFLRWVTQ